MCLCHSFLLQILNDNWPLRKDVLYMRVTKIVHMLSVHCIIGLESFKSIIFKTFLRLWGLELIFLVYSIVYTKASVSNVHLYMAVCKTYVAFALTQGQDHTWRSKTLLEIHIWITHIMCRTNVAFALVQGQGHTWRWRRDWWRDMNGIQQ